MWWKYALSRGFYTRQTVSTAYLNRIWLQKDDTERWLGPSLVGCIRRERTVSMCTSEDKDSHRNELPKKYRIAYMHFSAGITMAASRIQQREHNRETRKTG